MLGVSEWSNTASLGRTGREDEEGVSPLMLTGWSAWNSTRGWMRRHQELMGQDLREGRDR